MKIILIDVFDNFIDELLIMDKPGPAFYYYVHDHLYSPVALVGQIGGVIERYEYDAYGNPTIWNATFTSTRSSSSYGNPYMFTGRCVDYLDSGSLKIQYNQNRYYDYYTGRWFTHDPLGINPAGGNYNQFEIRKQYSDGMCLYEYVKSNPVTLADPTGLESCGLSVYCGDIDPDNPFERISSIVSLRHCELRGLGATSSRSNPSDYRVWVDRSSCGRKLLNGPNKPCKCATCEDIKSCLLQAGLMSAGRFPQLGDNCHTWTARQLSRCCLKTTWRPAWYAGDWSCVSWAIRYYVEMGPGGAYIAARRVCVERTPGIY